MAPILIALFLFGFLSPIQATEPIVNSSGEYYIATQSNPFSHQSIACNSSIPNCYIICPFQDACLGANISCSSINCNIQCNHWSSCANTTIDGTISSNHSLSSVNTTSTGLTKPSIQNHTNHHMKLLCQSASSYTCSHSTIICPINHRCDIICSGGIESEYLCSHMNIIPPNNKSLFNLIFNGSSSLWGVNFPIYPLDSHQTYTLLCNEINLCGGLNVSCPQHGYCYIECTATSACNWVSNRCTSLLYCVFFV